MSSTAKNHIVAAPVFLYGFRVAQLVVALVVLGLCAYGIRWWSFDGNSIMLFSAIATIMITIYVGVASIVVPAMYNYWAILGLDIFAIIFWAISFPLLSSEVASYSAAVSHCAYFWDGVCYSKDKRIAIAKRDTTSVSVYASVSVYKNAMAAAAGLGGLEFLFFATTLAIFSMHLYRHRKAGDRHMPKVAAVATDVKYSKV